MLLKAPACMILLLLLGHSVFSQIPIGGWRDHLPYQQAIKVVSVRDRIFCATPFSLFSVELKDNNIDRLSKTNGLSEVGISAIQADEQTNKLVIAYTNSNIDILYNNKIVNIDAIKRKNLPGDKKIYKIFCHQDKAYLSTGLGIIVIDESKYEVKDTYVIGNTGNHVKVNGFSTDGKFYYAATEEGLKKAATNTANLADYRNWVLMSGAGLSAGGCQDVVNLHNKIIVQKDDSIFMLDGITWKLIFTSGWEIVHANSSSGKLVITQRRPSGGSKVVVLNADGSLSQTIEQPNITNAQEGIIVEDDVWIADLTSGLIRSSGSSSQSYLPNSPLSIATGEMTVQKNALWVASGTVTPAWSNTFNKNGLYRFANNEWDNYNGTNLPAFNNVYDIVTIAVDSRDNAVWAGSYGEGLLRLEDNRSVKIFKENSVIESSLSDPNSYRVAGLTFDDENNLWIANYGAAQNLSVLKASGGWIKFQIPFSHSYNAVTQIIVDDYNQKWIVSPNGNGLFCFNHGSSIDNTGDDRWKFFRAGKGNGNLPDNSVLSIAKDKNGLVWVGTSRGIGIIQCPQQVFAVQACEAILPVVQQDNFAGYLFRDEEVQSIAIDGGDRKWIGTKNGVWLISANAEKTIYYFKEDNSPLLSNDVKKIAIDPQSGEVFFATAKGLCSFRSTATEGGTANENVFVFPNPVPPGYHGKIAIRGLANNAIVKITELDGRLVYQTRAAGGQAIWNGSDYKGNQISTGVYLIVVSDETRQEKMVSKIVFVR